MPVAKQDADASVEEVIQETFGEENSAAPGTSQANPPATGTGKAHWVGVLRASPWLVFALAMAVAVAFVAPHQLYVLTWSLAKLGLAAFLGYWMDRTLFPHGRPAEQTDNNLRQAAWLRRAIIIAASVIALGLGV